MPKILLVVSHLLQKADKEFGTPFRNIARLERYGFSVSIGSLTLSEIDLCLRDGLPILAGVHTADLGYWSQAVDHVVVVIGLDDEYVYVNDPSLDHGQQAIPRTEFELAQLDFDNLCAVIR